MADAIGYWTAPGMTVDAVVDFLKTHAPPGLDFVDVTSSNATCATASPGATFVPWGG